MENQTHLNPNLGSESYFYASHLTSGCVPRFVVTLRLGIDEDILRIALDDIQQRFPQMSVQIQRTADGKNYELVDNPRPIPIFTDNGSVVRTMGTEQTNYHLVTITSYEKYMIFDFHHLLGDGTGFIIFIKAMVYHYLELRGVPLENDGTILTVDQDRSEEEWEDPYIKLADKECELPQWYKPGLKAFSIPVSTDDNPTDTVVQIRLPFKRFSEVFKSFGSSPVTFLSLIFCHAIFEKYEESIGDRCIVASVPVNLRPYYPTKTLRYFITVASLAHAEIFRKEDLVGQLHTQKSLLDEQTNPTILTKLAQNHIEGMRKFRELDMTVEEKAILMDDKVRKSMENFTFVITNMGNITLPASMQQYIDEFYPILPTATCPYTIATTTWKGELMLSITQRSTDTSVCKRFVEILNDMDIPAYLADTFLFHTMEAKPL